jgi:predicted RNA-binding Zn ribbon-like protein
VRQLTAETIRLMGGTLCLDFVNTTEWAGRGTRIPDSFDVLAVPGALVSWGRRLEVLTTSGRVEATEDDIAAALALRATIHDTFASIAAGDAPGEDALSRLHAIYAQATAKATLVRDSTSSWRLAWPELQVDSVRHAVASDAIALLADSDRLTRVKQCPGPHCGGLFLDASGRRRWCSMDACGSRTKMRRLYERQRAAATTQTNRRGEGRDA